MNKFRKEQLAESSTEGHPSQIDLIPTDREGCRMFIAECISKCFANYPASEQKRFMNLIGNIGNVVFIINDDEIIEYDVLYVEIKDCNEFGYSIRNKEHKERTRFMLENIGEDVFLNREAAEKKLAEILGIVPGYIEKTAIYKKIAKLEEAAKKDYLGASTKAEKNVRLAKMNAITAVKSLIGEHPVSDVASVVHATWEKAGSWYPHCTNCNYVPEIDTRCEDFYNSPYCPVCGAKMDLEE